MRQFLLSHLTEWQHGQADVIRCNLKGFKAIEAIFTSMADDFCIWLRANVAEATVVFNLAPAGLHRTKANTAQADFLNAGAGFEREHPLITNSAPIGIDSEFEFFLHDVFGDLLFRRAESGIVCFTGHNIIGYLS